MKKIFLAYIALFLSACMVMRAGDNGSIPSVAIPSDPVALAMGTVSSYGNYAFAARNNITAAARMEQKAAVAMSYTMWNTAGAPKHIPSVAAAIRHRNWGFAVDTDTYADGRTYSVYDEKGAENRVCRPYNARLSFGASYAFACGFSAGIVANGVYSVIHPEYKAAAVSCDVYAGYDSRYVSAVIAVANLGMPVRYYEDAPASYMPMLVKAGLNVRPVKGLQAAVEGDYMLNNNSWMFNAGVQYTIMDIAAVRAGYHYGTAGADAIGPAVVPSYFAAGVGFHFKGLSIDASYLFAGPVLDNTFSVSLGYCF